MRAKLLAKVGNLTIKERLSRVTVSIDSVGFSGDHKIFHWPQGDAIGNPIGYAIDPNDNTALWRSGNVESQYQMLGAAYTSKTKATVFGTFKITPEIPVDEAFTAKVRVFDKGNPSVVAYGYLALVGGVVGIRDLTFQSAWPWEKAISYPTLEWQIEYSDTEYEYGDKCWYLAGDSIHKLYWLVDKPKDHPFRNLIGTFYDAIYDRVIEAALDFYGPPTYVDLPNRSNMALRLAHVVPQHHPFKPDVVFGDQHPFVAWKDGSRAGGVGYAADVNANLVTGMLRSIGVPAETVYVWSGTAGIANTYWYQKEGEIAVDRNFQADLDEHDDAPEKPHFSAHVIVRSEGNLYDPTYRLPYGDTPYEGVDFLESWDENVYKAFVTGNGTRVIDGTLPMSVPMKDPEGNPVTCPHH